MDINVKKVLEVNNEDDYLELEVDDLATIWLTNGCCMSVEITEIDDNLLVGIDEDGNECIIDFNDIEEIQEN